MHWFRNCLFFSGAVQGAREGKIQDARHFLSLLEPKWPRCRAIIFTKERFTDGSSLEPSVVSDEPIVIFGNKDGFTCEYKKTHTTTRKRTNDRIHKFLHDAVAERASISMVHKKVTVDIQQ